MSQFWPNCVVSKLRVETRSGLNHRSFKELVSPAPQRTLAWKHPGLFQLSKRPWCPPNWRLPTRIAILPKLKRWQQEGVGCGMCNSLKGKPQDYNWTLWPIVKSDYFFGPFFLPPVDFDIYDKFWRSVNKRFCVQVVPCQQYHKFKPSGIFHGSVNIASGWMGKISIIVEGLAQLTGMLVLGHADIYYLWVAQKI